MKTALSKGRCHVFFETLATELKIGIIGELEGKPRGVNELSARLREERSKVSHALLSLAECGFVRAEKRGRERIYSLNRDTIVPLLRLVRRHVSKHCAVCRKK